MLPWLAQVREAQSVAPDVFDVIERKSKIDPFGESGSIDIRMSIQK
jgi:hypothetical protein